MCSNARHAALVVPKPHSATFRLAVFPVQNRKNKRKNKKISAKEPVRNRGKNSINLKAVSGTPFLEQIRKPTIREKALVSSRSLARRRRRPNGRAFVPNRQP